jgi:FemAB-related protein (PEP-CTERM system-associated)
MLVPMLEECGRRDGFGYMRWRPRVALIRSPEILPVPMDGNSASSVTIELCEELHKDEWDRFLVGRGGASHYHLYDWREVNEQVLGHKGLYLAARSNRGIVGVLPLVWIQSRVLNRVLCSMPFVNYGGPCAETSEWEEQLIRAAMRQAADLRADYLELRCIRQHEMGLPVSLRNVSMTLELNKDPEAVWNAFSSKHRKNVRRAYKHGLATQSGGQELMADFYRLMEQSWKTLGTPLYGRDFFERILATFPDSTRIFVCKQGNEPVAAALVGYFNGVVEGMWAGGGRVARELDANFVLYWDMIKDACERGMTRFHLGRSSASSGGEEFKRKWNAGTAQLYWYFHRPDAGPLPEMNVDNPRFRLAIAAWKRMPHWMTRVAGPRIARLLP